MRHAQRDVAPFPFPTIGLLSPWRLILLAALIVPPALPAQDHDAANSAIELQSRYVNVGSDRMHYLDAGAGDPILFIHGNPTSSHVWRNIMPRVAERGRVIAIDLIGFGKSDKPDLEYTVADHTRYLNGFIEALDLDDLILVVQDWGSFLGFQYAMSHSARVKGVVFMESLLPQTPVQGGQAVAERFRDRAIASSQLFREFADPVRGRELLIDENAFVERFMPLWTLRTLSEEEMDVYREPFTETASRLPIFMFRQEVGTPDNRAISQEYATWLSSSEMPKLMFRFTPGAITRAGSVQWARDNLTNLTVVDGGEGIHYVQEDQPEVIGRAIVKWIDSNGLSAVPQTHRVPTRGALRADRPTPRR